MTTSLLFGIGDGLVKKLQAVQNSAARVVTGTRKYDYITPVLRDLHWLPARHRIDFKVAMTVFKCIHGLAPQYLADNCVLASTVRSRRHLRSADTMKLVVQRTKTVIGPLQSLLLLYGTDYQLTFEPLRARFRHLHTKKTENFLCQPAHLRIFFYFAQ